MAETLEGQTHQMEKIQGDLDEIKFTLKKAQKVIRDITRSMATDKCAPVPALHATVALLPTTTMILQLLQLYALGHASAHWELAQVLTEPLSSGLRGRGGADCPQTCGGGGQECDHSHHHGVFAGGTCTGTCHALVTLTYLAVPADSISDREATAPSTILA